jgi:hypothetical protein
MTEDEAAILEEATDNLKEAAQRIRATRNRLCVVGGLRAELQLQGLIPARRYGAGYDGGCLRRGSTQVRRANGR